MKLYVYTDGACSGNPGPGGYAALLVQEGNVIDSTRGSEEYTTNNRMELQAVIEGIKLAAKKIEKMRLIDHIEVVVITDSQYVQKGFTEWMKKWKANGWKTTTKRPVKNIDLWKELHRLENIFGSILKFEWTKGHNGNEHNELADRIAVESIPRKKNRCR